MRLYRAFFKVAVSCIVGLGLVATASAVTPVHGTSHYGPSFANNPDGITSPDTFYADCAAGMLTPCMSFNVTPASSSDPNGSLIFTTSDGFINGVPTPVNEYLFAFNAGSGASVLDVLNLGPLASGATFILPPGFSAAGAGVLSCDDANFFSKGLTGIADSGDQLIVGSNLCTQIDTTTALINLNTGTGVFTVGQDFSSGTGLVLFDVPTAATPEPGTMLLAGAGLLGLVCLKFLRA
jgi:hypothetical protein